MADALKSETESLYTAPVTVLGIGNVILSDEGFGVRVVEYLAANYDFPDEVQLIDGGTLGIELTHYVTGTDKLLIIDSINGGKAPGTEFRFTGSDIKAHFADKISAHEIGIQDVLTMLELTGRKIPRMTVIGAQPYHIGAGVNLSEPMQKLLRSTAVRAIEELESWGISPRPKAASSAVDLSTVAEVRL